MKRPPLKADARAGKALPRLLAFTDPRRTPDVEAYAEGLPTGAALVFRPFGADDAEEQAFRLLDIAHALGLSVLIGADVELAARIGADGVHLPERLAARAGRLKARHPDWIVTAAAHSLAAARRAARSGADAAVVSTAFPSKSPSAGAPLGPVRMALLARRAGLPVYALGGVTGATVARLRNAGLAGFAAIEGFK